LKNKTKYCEWFSLAIDESTHECDGSELLLFFLGVGANFEVTEGAASISGMYGTTTGKDIFKKV
jgi:hypothetical protein